MKKKVVLIAVVSALIIVGGCRAIGGSGGGGIELETQTMCEVLSEASRFSVVDLGEKQEEKAYAGRCEKGLAGYVFLISEEGYRSRIYMAVGVDTDINVTGVRVMKQKETKGRGSLITETAFLSQFCETDRRTPESVEVVSGATVSSQAVARGVQKAIALAEELM